MMLVVMTQGLAIGLGYKWFSTIPAAGDMQQRRIIIRLYFELPTKVQADISEVLDDLRLRMLAMLKETCEDPNLTFIIKENIFTGGNFVSEKDTHTCPASSKDLDYDSPRCAFQRKTSFNLNWGTCDWKQ